MKGFHRHILMFLVIKLNTKNWYLYL